MTDGERFSILIVTVNEYYYIPKFLRTVCATDEFDIEGIVTVPPSLGTENIVRFVHRLFETFGPRVFVQHVLFYTKHLVLDYFNYFSGTGQAYSPRTLAARHDIEYRHVTDVNTAEFIDYAQTRNPDLLVSVAATQKFGAELLNVPSEGAINIHSSLLPEYRGVSPSFWTLLHDEEQTGISVHYMDTTIDTGDIIRQEPVAIRDDDTLHTLNTRVANKGADVLLAALYDIRSEDVQATPVDPETGSYYSMPTREDVREFLRRGNRFY